MQIQIDTELIEAPSDGRWLNMQSTGRKFCGPFPIGDDVMDCGPRGTRTTFTVRSESLHPLTLGFFERQTGGSTSAQKRLAKFHKALDNAIAQDPELLTRECESITFSYLRPKDWEENIIEGVVLKWRQTEWQQKIESFGSRGTVLEGSTGRTFQEG